MDHDQEPLHILIGEGSDQKKLVQDLDDGSGLKDYDISIKSFEEMCFRLEQRKITHFWLKESNL